jgi:glycosyltransferase involved in cell wall biosynthesis
MSKDDSRIRFAGPLSRPQLPEFFASIDLLAVPSVWLETGPLVVLEALAHGVPVLGSKRGGIAELVQDGVNGLLVPVDTPAAWRDVLARLVREPLLVEQLRVEPPAVRTWAEVAEEMVVVYGAVTRARAEPLSSCEQFLPTRD